MWVVSALAFLANPLLGAVLLISAAITTGLKVAKVDAEYAKQGKTPPSHALISKWLDSRAAKGAKPQKPAKYGMWRYAWQRWQALWQDLGDRHQEVRDQYKAACAKAKAAGTQPPPKPTVKETLTGWKWHLDRLTAPEPAASGATPGRADPDLPTPVYTTCRYCGRTDQALGNLDICEGCLVQPPQTGTPSDTTTKANADKVPVPGPKPQEPARWDHRTNAAPGGTGNPNLFARPSNVPPTMWEHAQKTRLPCPKCGAATRLDQPGDAAYALYFCRNCDRVTESWGWDGVASELRLCVWCYQHPAGQPCGTGHPEPVPVNATPSRAAPGPGPTATKGDTMTASTQTGEVTGIPSAVHYMTQVAATHTQHGGNEQVITAMRNMNIGDGDIALVEQAKEKSRNAAELWELAATTIDVHNAGVREGYSAAPDAADKTAQMAE